MQHSIKTFRSILFTLLILFATALSSFATVRVEHVSPGIDGYVRSERWVPIVFDLRSTQDFQGRIEVLKGDTVFRKSVDLAAGTGKRIEVLIYYSNFFQPLTYRLVDLMGRKVIEDRIEPRLLNYEDNLVLVVSDSEYNHQFLNGEQNPWGGKTFVAYRKSSELYSEWIAYSSADAIALGSFSVPEISPASWKTLLIAVAQGKPLICSAGTDFSILQDPLLRDALPAITPDFNLMSKGEFLASRWTAHSSAQFPNISFPAQTAQARPWEHELLAFSPDSSLIVASPFYKSAIVYFAFDYTRIPEVIRNIFATFWNETIHPAVPSPPPVFTLPFRKRLEENPQVQKFLYDIPGLRLPDAKWFALFFFIYLMAMGPLQYLLLRILKKNTWLWVTFPAIILVFSAASFGYSRYRHSGSSKITEVGVVELFPTLDLQVVNKVYGTSLSESGVFDFQAEPENGYLRKFLMQSMNYQPEPFTLSEDLPHALVGETLKNWSFRAFESISTQAISTPLHVDVVADENMIRGVIRNDTNLNLTKSFFFYTRTNVYAVGDIPAHSSREFSFAVKGRRSMPYTEQYLRDLLNLYSPTYSSPHFFYAEASGSKGSISVNGKIRDTFLYQYLAVYVQVRSQSEMTPWETPMPAQVEY